MAAAGVIRLWDVQERKETKVLHGHRGPVRAIAFGADGKTLASGGADHAVFLWEVATGQKKAARRDIREPSMQSRLPRTGKTLASGGVGAQGRSGNRHVSSVGRRHGEGPRCVHDHRGGHPWPWRLLRTANSWSPARGRTRSRCGTRPAAKNPGACSAMSAGLTPSRAEQRRQDALATGSYDRTARLVGPVRECKGHDVLRGHGSLD